MPVWILVIQLCLQGSCSVIWEGPLPSLEACSAAAFYAEANDDRLVADCRRQEQS